MAAALFSESPVIYKTASRILAHGSKFMAIYDLDGLLKKYSDEFLILEFNHLFVSSSIREEVWLLQRKNDSPLIDKIIRAAREYDIHEVSGSRDFETYSGGQKAILACLLLLEVVGDRKTQDLKLLLNNILDSISAKNQAQLIKKFDEVRSSHNIRLFVEKDGRVREILSGNENTQG